VFHINILQLLMYCTCFCTVLFYLLFIINLDIYVLLALNDWYAWLDLWQN